MAALFAGDRYAGGSSGGELLQAPGCCKQRYVFSVMFQSSSSSSSFSSSTSLHVNRIIRLVLSITAFSIARPLTKGRGRERRRRRGRLGSGRSKQESHPARWSP